MALHHRRSPWPRPRPKPRWWWWLPCGEEGRIEDRPDGALELASERLGPDPQAFRRQVGSVVRQMPYSHTNGHIDGRPCCTPRWGRERGVGSARHRSVRARRCGLATLSTFDTQNCCWSLLFPSSIRVAWSACENGRALQCILSTGCLCVCSACSCRVGTNRHLLPLAWARPPEPWQPRGGRHEPYVRFRLPEGPTRMRMRNHLPKGQGSD
jgi:hypothetical protein